MATQTIYFLIFVAVATPIIWWLMWREDFDGRQSEWRFNRERKNREHLSPPQFYDCYYQTSGIDRNVVNRLLSICAKQFAVEATLIRPGDDYFRIFNVDAIEFLDELKLEFGITLTDRELEDIDGSFDSIVRYLDRRLKQHA